MKILISGVCGFVGSHLTRYLIESHEGIIIVGLAIGQRNQSNLAAAPRRAAFP